MKNDKSAKLQLYNLMSFLGQSIANEYKTRVGKIKETTLTFFDNGRQITINVSIKDLLGPVFNAPETFRPEKPVIEPEPTPDEEDPIVEPGDEDATEEDPDEDDEPEEEETV